MTCHDAREQFSALVDDALTADERAGLDAHLASCADCRRELQRFRDTVSLVRAVAPVRAPAGFVDRVLEAARSVPWPRRLVRGLFLPWPVKLPMEAAAIVLVAVGVALVYRGTPELQQSARLEPASPVVARAPESMAPPGVGPVPPRETALERKLDALRDRPTAKDQAQALAKTGPAREAPEPTKATEPAPPPPATAPQPEALSRDAVVREQVVREQKERRAKQEASREFAEQPASQDAQAPRAPGARAETSQAPTAATRPPASPNVTASLFAPAEVLGQLAVTDRESALRQVGELITRLGAIQNRRVDGPDGSILELTIQRDAYAEFTRELARLGRWQPTREPSSLPAQLRVVLRITS
jgi:anti-sigma factor RsiW